MQFEQAKEGVSALNRLLPRLNLLADDTLADALSTALFVMGPERAADFWRVHRAEFGAVWLTDDGRLFVTEGLTLTTEREYEVVS